MRASLGSFGDHPEVNFVGSFVQVLEQLPADAPCIALEGNLVLAASQLRGLLDNQAARPAKSSVWEHRRRARRQYGGGAVGPTGLGLRRAPPAATPGRAGNCPSRSTGGRRTSRRPNVRLASEVRRESADTDALMARWVDRRLSWRISLRLARTAITPNQVTLANTALGFL